jgi:hypothetical protein
MSEQKRMQRELAEADTTVQRVNRLDTISLRW